MPAVWAKGAVASSMGRCLRDHVLAERPKHAHIESGTQKNGGECMSIRPQWVGILTCAGQAASRKGWEVWGIIRGAAE